ncbi:MAG: Uncharacterised protein [Prochlorococcus marinus str. MIT 9215]|nr:MAG: Uncharacterised protein [Prochlorococcus marinus str. MIT 9215]
MQMADMSALKKYLARVAIEGLLLQQMAMFIRIGLTATIVLTLLAR